MAHNKPFSMIREFHLADWFTLANAVFFGIWAIYLGQRLWWFQRSSTESLSRVSGRASYSLYWSE